jgi:hypothetical protein
MERIVITFNQDGSFRGASVTDFDGLPKPLDEAGLTAIAPSINTASLAAQAKAESELSEAKTKAEADLKAEQEQAATKLSEVNADLSAEKAKVASLEAYKTAMIQKVSSALASNDLEQIQALAVEFLTPEEELKRAAKLAQLEALKAELGL